MTTLDTLGKIIGSPARIKLMRLFLFHPTHGFARDELRKKTKITAGALRTELSLLEKAEFVHKREITKTEVKKVKGRKKTVSKTSTRYLLNPTFSLLEPLSVLLLESELVAVPELPGRFKSAGKIKLFVVSGMFMRDPHRSLDMLIVGDRLDLKAITKAVSLLESEIGKELRYSTFTSDEFMYRIKMYDKLIRDVFDFPHQRLVNQLSLPQFS